MIAGHTDKSILTCSLQSGSNGNCIFIAAGGVKILIDAGISGKRAADRLASIGEDINSVDALLISHDHSDHSRCAGIFSRKFKLPVYSTVPTASVIAESIGDVADYRYFESGSSFEIGPIVIHTHPTPHDGADGVCFVMEYASRSVGVLTDLGFVFPELEDIIPELDGVYLESNYDPDMLDTGPYPWNLKQRIYGDGGHISNAEAGQLLDHCCGGRLKWVKLSHLSEQNNTPEKALKCVESIVSQGKSNINISVASRYGCSEIAFV